MNEKELALKAVKILDDKKAEDLRLFHIEEHTVIADYFVVATGTSSTHVKALADEVEYELSKLGVEVDHIEGRATGWILLDYGTVIVHVFSKESRDFYNLERLWADAPEEDISDLLT